MNGNVTIAHNTAARNGGDVYLSNSELNYQQNSIFVLWNNTAVHKGRELHAISSSVKVTSSFTRFGYTGAKINIMKNAAERGGGLSLEASAKFYILKYDYSDDDHNRTIFTANHADYGGAVYMDNESNSGTCASNTKSECFFQVLAIYLYANRCSDMKIQSMYFSQNFANISGSTLYGGLLDRCAVGWLAEIRNKHSFFEQNYEYKGESYFKDISTGENTLISSLPVRVCTCISNEPNCTHQSYTDVKKEKYSHGQLLLSIRLANQLVQPSKPPSTSLRVV